MVDLSDGERLGWGTNAKIGNLSATTLHQLKVSHENANAPIVLCSFVFTLAVSASGDEMCEASDQNKRHPWKMRRDRGGVVVVQNFVVFRTSFLGRLRLQGENK